MRRAVPHAVAVRDLAPDRFAGRIAVLVHDVEKFVGELLHGEKTSIGRGAGQAPRDESGEKSLHFEAPAW